MVVSAAKISDPLSDNTPVYEASVLTKGGDIARILLNDQVYTLRITRAGKLILTK